MRKIVATIATVAAMAAITAGSAAASLNNYDSALPPGFPNFIPLRPKTAPAPVVKPAPTNPAIKKAPPRPVGGGWAQ